MRTNPRNPLTAFIGFQTTQQAAGLDRGQVEGVLRYLVGLGASTGEGERMQPKACPACEHFDSKTVDRLLGLGYSPRFVSKRFIVLSRRALERHAAVCMPPRLGEVHDDLRRLAGMEEGGGA